MHTYYVLAGETPVLVHNSNCPSALARSKISMFSGRGNTKSGSRMARLRLRSRVGARRMPMRSMLGKMELRCPAVRMFVTMSTGCR
ncbi:hypothetical protein [Streptomyces sp. KL116D]|uniref:hypothetical protein n=1 Tax=Streptomyces sp. KL116D TaxID=3045152 RepID=UPI003557C837